MAARTIADGEPRSHLADLLKNRKKIMSLEPIGHLKMAMRLLDILFGIRSAWSLGPSLIFV